MAIYNLNRVFIDISLLDIVGEFEQIEANDSSFAEFKVLRDYYDKKIDFDKT